ncbi:MAG: sigma-E factor negative regulatory protein [Ramlibacter sp.]
MNNMQTKEIISALADGQLQGEAFARGAEVACSDPAAREAWQTFHLIGDVLRSGELATGTAPAAFLSRLQERLQREPQPLPLAQAPLASTWPVAAEIARGAPANDASFRWKLVAGFASLAAVAAVGWTVVGGMAGPPEQAQLASRQGPAVAAEPGAGVMIRDPRLDELLAAHRQMGGASALQMPAGFLRNATFEGPAR